MSERGRFEHSSRVMHHGRHCERCTQFYTDSEGEVHPIRGSPGYDPSVEHSQREARERHRLTAMYGRERAERGRVVERPPWAAGIPDRHLILMAKAHGQNAGAPLWWERANLVGASEQIVGGRRVRARQSGELREALRGRSSRDKRSSAGVDTVERELAEMSSSERRRTLAADRRRQAEVREDLPW